MEDLINNEDSRIEHQFHLLYQPNCSTCWSENLRIQGEGRDIHLENEEALSRSDDYTDKNPLG